MKRSRIRHVASGEPSAFLKRIGTGGERFDLAEAALALAQLARPELELAAYRQHLAELADSVAAAAAGGPNTLAARLQALIRTLAGEHGYRGDRDSYDDLGNADLARVIDRRRGIPVSLGILYIATARAQGWTMIGLNTPGHFLARLEAGGEGLVMDPFAGQAVEADDGQPAPDDLPVADDRAILLRLQNNIKTRLLDQERYGEAEAVLERMLWIAPAAPRLWWESALVNAELGNLGAAIGRLDGFLDLAPDAAKRREAEALRRGLRAKLN